MGPEQAYARLLDVSGAVSVLVILAMLLERALALLFDYHWFQKLSEKIEGLKSPIAFFVSWFICNFVGFDILSRLFPPANGTAEPRAIGVLITAAVVAGECRSYYPFSRRSKLQSGFPYKLNRSKQGTSRG